MKSQQRHNSLENHVNLLVSAINWIIRTDKDVNLSWERKAFTFWTPATTLNSLTILQTYLLQVMFCIQRCHTPCINNNISIILLHSITFAALYRILIVLCAYCNCDTFYVLWPTNTVKTINSAITFRTLLIQKNQI